MKKNIFLILFLIMSSFAMSACLPGLDQTNEGVETIQKQGDTTMTGQITESNGVYFISNPGGTPQVINSYSVDFSDFLGQTVTVTGQYSGDELFVDQIK